MIVSMDTSQLVIERRLSSMILTSTFSCYCLAKSGLVVGHMRLRWIAVIIHIRIFDFMDEPSTSYIGLQPGDFVVIAPGELHTPLCTLTEPGELRKYVFKVHKALLSPSV